ncbi:MAG: hypothetical protein CL927_05635 [Deltaproteobacteria bacterium]|nr:hypothetical protein [Deltaproteobacteria bacterium]HCH63489.1 hypothetical protein [Deltaproteobacteria bacterium]
MIRSLLLLFAVTLCLASSTALAEESDSQEESDTVILPTCKEIAAGIHPKAVKRVVKNKYSACKATCQVAKLKGEAQPDCKSTCKADYKADKLAVACNAG